MKIINPYKPGNREIGRILIHFGSNFKQIEGYFRKTDRDNLFQSHSVTFNSLLCFGKKRMNNYKNGV